MSNIRSVLASFGLSLLLVGCGDGGSTQESDTPAVQPSTAQQAAAQANDEPKREWGDCDLFTKEELTEAFGGRLTFGNLSGFRGRGSSCTVSVQGYEGEFILQAESREAFENRRETYKEYVRQGSATMEAATVGAEAYVINNAQVIAIDSEGRAINVALQLFVFGDDLPMSPEQVAVGVETIAQKALDRL